MTGRFSLLISVGVLVFITYKQVTWEARPDGSLALVSRLPIPSVVWFTATWLMACGGLWLLLCTPAASRAPTNDLVLRRITVFVVGTVYTADVLARLSGRLGTVGPALLLAGAGVAIGLCVYRPPRLPVLLGWLVALGVSMRLLYLAVYAIDPQRADNMATVQNGLAHLVSGHTPYVLNDFGTHATHTTYLPWTILAYLPAYVAGVDIRITNVVLSLALVVALWWILGALRLPTSTLVALRLAAGIFYVLPYSVSNDGLTEASVYGLCLTATFGLLAIGRTRSAAVAFGFAVGAFQLSVYCLPALLVYVLRTFCVRQVVQLAGIVFLVGAVPVLAIAAWDPPAFFAAMLDAPSDAWARLDSGRWADWAFTPAAWHAVLGGRLRVVEALLLALFVTLAWTRLRTVHGVVGLAIGTYLALVLSGAYIGGHFFAVTLYLAVLAEGARAAAARDRSHPR